MNGWQVRRVTPEETRMKLDSGEAILVCGYETEDKFAAAHLDGAVSLRQFQARLPDIRMNQEIIFYCACPAEETSTRRAAELLQRGYAKVETMAGGVKGWLDAGYAAVEPVAKTIRGRETAPTISTSLL